MAYEFGNFPPADFEDLVRGLIGREFGGRFEAFAAGPDAGMDGRHANGSPSSRIKTSRIASQACTSL